MHKQNSNNIIGQIKKKNIGLVSPAALHGCCTETATSLNTVLTALSRVFVFLSSKVCDGRKPTREKSCCLLHSSHLEVAFPHAPLCGNGISSHSKITSERSARNWEPAAVYVSLIKVGQEYRGRMPPFLKIWKLYMEDCSSPLCHLGVPLSGTATELAEKVWRIFQRCNPLCSAPMLIPQMQKRGTD